MKKMYLSMLLLIGFQVMVNAQIIPSCGTPIIDNASTIAELNTAIDLMETNSAFESRTIVIAAGIYNSSTFSSLNRDIDVEGGCPCTIKGEKLSKDGIDVYLKGDVSWRLNDSKNLTIDGIIFRRTEYTGARPVIYLGSGSDSNTISNSVLMEFNSGPSISGNNYFIEMDGGIDNTVDTCIFQNKYSIGNYVWLKGTQNLKIRNSIFRENDTNLFSATSGSKRYIYAENSSNLRIENSSFSNKYSKIHYVQLIEGTGNYISGNTFYESTDPEDLDEPLNTTITNSGNKDYIKLVDELNPSIISNNFIRKFSLGNYVNYAPTKDSITNIMSTIYGGTIKGNEFRRKYQLQPSSMLRIGSCYSNSDGDVARTDVIVDSNIFEHYNYNEHWYSEIVSNKASGNEYYNNEFINCYGSLRIRCGDDIIINGNKFKGVRDVTATRLQRGIAISGKRHQIYNNHFQDLTFFAFEVYGGNGSTDTEVGYVQVDKVDFAFNTIVDCDLNIGFRSEADMNGNNILFEMATNCRIENNIVSNENISNNVPLIFINSNYGGTQNINDFSTNSFMNNAFYNQTNSNNFITNSWTLPNALSTITNDPELSYDTINEVYKLTASSPSTIVNSAYNDPIEPYSYVSHDILGTTRGANRDIGCHEYDNVSRTASNTVGLFENANIKLQSYPNPVNDVVTLSGISKDSKYTIYNINGVLVQEGSLSNNQQIKVEILAKGMYFLTINNSETIKLIKN